MTPFSKLLLAFIVSAVVCIIMHYIASSLERLWYTRWDFIFNLIAILGMLAVLITVVLGFAVIGTLIHGMLG